MAIETLPGTRVAKPCKASTCRTDGTSQAPANLPAFFYSEMPFIPDPVNGWDSDGITSLSKPPVMVNPEASTGDLIAWARSQLEQATNITGLVGGGSYEHGPGAYLAVESSHHFSLQALAVLSAVSTRLQNEAFAGEVSTNPAAQAGTVSESPDVGGNIGRLLHEARMLASGAQVLAEDFEDALAASPAVYPKLPMMRATLARVASLIESAEQIQAGEHAHG